MATNRLLVRLPTRLLFTLMGLTSSATHVYAVRYGDVLTPKEFNSVGQVVVLGDAFEQKYTGTGTLIAPDIVITAAHVIEKAKTPFHIKFHLDGNPQTASVVAVRPAPSYRRSVQDMTATPADDIAFLKLDGSLRGDFDYYPPLADHPIRRGMRAKAIGFGLDETRKLNIRSSGTVKYYRQRPNGCLLFVPGDEKNQITDSGDSGGPLLVRQSGSWGIVALVHGKFFFEPEEMADTEYDAIDLGVYVDLRRHRRWMNAAIKELRQLPAPASAPSYIPAADLNQPRMPLTVRQVCGLIAVATPPATLLQIVGQRGLCEPLDGQALSAMRNAGATPEWLATVQRMAQPLMTYGQVAALLRIGTGDQQILQTCWKRGLPFGRLDEATAHKLQAAGASKRLLHAMKNLP